MTIIERFMAKVEMVTESGCWLWTGCEHKTGYGRFGMVGAEIEYAHRAGYRLFRGSIPKGLYVCHSCDTRMCVNPRHMFLGTAKDNMGDCSRKGRMIIPAASHASSEKHQLAILTDEQVRELRRSPLSATELSKTGLYPVGFAAIWNAKTRRTFRDVL